jgi:hypothetical protein
MYKLANFFKNIFKIFRNILDKSIFVGYTIL